MRSLTRIFLGSLLAAAATSVASAETPTVTPSIEPGEFVHTIELRLDDEFEKSATRSADSVLGRLAGPSSMDCSPTASRSALETCVVTTEGTPLAAVPAALAQH